MRRLIVPLLAAALALSVAPLVAQSISDCPGHDGFKVFLDRPAVASNQIDDLQFLLNEILFLFNDRKEREWIEWLPEGDSSSVQFVLCDQRQPSMDGSDFDRHLVDLLYNNDVLVELLASLRARQDSAGNLTAVALLRYVVVPVRQLHFEGVDTHDGFFTARLSTSGDAADFLQLFESVRGIDHYVAAGLGVKAARRGDYDAAQRGLCRGLAALSDEAPASLLDLLADLARRNLLEARADTSYGGALLLLDPARPCPGGGP